MRFSVITCTYNAAEVLQRTLDSVKCQSHPDVLHIIIDGMSKDSTMSLVRSYEAEQQHVVTVVSEPDKGLYDAMNKGLRMAAGDYVVFLNAGDTFANEHTLADIAHQLKDIADPEDLPGVIYGNTDLYDIDGNRLGQRRLQPPETLSWRSFRHGMLVCHQAFYARTDIAAATSYNLTYHLSADVDWCIRIMKETEKRQLSLHNSHMTLCHYLEGGMSVQNHRASLMERFNVMRRHYGFFSTLCMHAWFIIRQIRSKK